MVVKSLALATASKRYRSLVSGVRIAVDAMGGDFGPSVTVPACIRALAHHPELSIVLVGREPDIRANLPPDTSFLQDRLTITHCDDVVAMTDKPVFALRNRRQSSMRIAIELLQAGEVAACVSGGNTGALMAMGFYVLKATPGIDRPAICTALPTAEGHCYLLDLGANVDSRAEHLHQFAIMGSLLAQVLDDKASPEVVLLNIGEEANKGNSQVKLAAELIGRDKRLNYGGYLEADRLFLGEADVAVCDGFVGNVAIKSSEGTARLIASKIAQEFNRNLFTRLLAKMVWPAIQRVQKAIDPAAYNGAFFLGLQGVLVKSHGNADVDGFVRAIDRSLLAVENNMVALLDEQLELINRA
ncbi:MAG: phosphate acyltransferase PlsX [Pseudomonadales bacterium]